MKRRTDNQRKVLAAAVFFSLFDVIISCARFEYSFYAAVVLFFILVFFHKIKKHGYHIDCDQLHDSQIFRIFIIIIIIIFVNSLQQKAIPLHDSRSLSISHSHYLFRISSLMFSLFSLLQMAPSRIHSHSLALCVFLLYLIFINGRIFISTFIFVINTINKIELKTKYFSALEHE